MNVTMSENPISLGSEHCTDAALAWAQIRGRLAEYRRIFLFTDFDGTLCDLTPVPTAAAIDHRTRAVVKRLSGEPRITVAVLSGRSMSDVADRVGLPVIYGGDHGVEMHGADFTFVVPGAEEARLELPGVCNQIRRSTGRIAGALVEGKRYSASVHYRQTASDQIPVIREAVQRCVDSSRFEIRDGHCVFEIRPRLNWNKGDAVQWILERHKATAQQAICIGDDLTDEDMFVRVPAGVNVRVTDAAGEQTAARYFLTRPEVAEFLEGILDMVKG